MSPRLVWLMLVFMRYFVHLVLTWVFLFCLTYIDWNPNLSQLSQECMFFVCFLFQVKLSKSCHCKHITPWKINSRCSTNGGPVASTQTLLKHQKEVILPVLSALSIFAFSKEIKCFFMFICVLSFLFWSIIFMFQHGKSEKKNDSVDVNLNNLFYPSLTSSHFQIPHHLHKNVLFLL